MAVHQQLSDRRWPNSAMEASGGSGPASMRTGSRSVAVIRADNDEEQPMDELAEVSAAA